MCKNFKPFCKKAETPIVLWECEWRYSWISHVVWIRNARTKITDSQFFVNCEIGCEGRHWNNFAKSWRRFNSKWFHAKSNFFFLFAFRISFVERISRQQSRKTIQEVSLSRFWTTQIIYWANAKTWSNSQWISESSPHSNSLWKHFAIFIACDKLRQLLSKF